MASWNTRNTDTASTSHVIKWDNLDDNASKNNTAQYQMPSASLWWQCTSAQDDQKQADQQ